MNGGLYSGNTDAPHFSKIARSYLIHIGSLDWTKINPDIFGSMIQAVTDEEERSALGLHYTSVLVCRKPTPIRAAYPPVFGFLFQQKKLGAFFVKYTVCFLAPNISSQHGVSDLGMLKS